MKLFTYLAAGRVILAPVAPDTAELLRHDENALLVAPDDVEAAVGAMRRTLADPASWDRLARGALATSAGLTWDGRAERIEGLLRGWLSESPVRAAGVPWSASEWLVRTGKWLGRRATSP
jgi:starch synthase